MCPKDVDGMANSVDSAVQEQSDLSLHCLPRPSERNWDLASLARYLV